MKDIVSREVFAKFPEYIRGVVIARGVDNHGEKPKLIEMLSEVVTKATQDESLQAIKAHPRIANWRQAYTDFGTNPNKFYCSIESLGRRARRGDLRGVVDKLNRDIDKRGDPLASIIRGPDELWDVSLMKFIYEMTRSSLPDNLMQMETRGLLDMDARGVPADARVRIEELFKMVGRGDLEPGELKSELDRWGLFEEYEDRFFTIFKKGRR